MTETDKDERREIETESDNSVRGSYRKKRERQKGR